MAKVPKKEQHQNLDDYEVIYQLVRGNYNQPLTIAQKELFDRLEQIKFWSMQYIDDSNTVRFICANLGCNETDAYFLLGKVKKIFDIMPSKTMVGNSIMNELQALITANQAIGDLKEARYCAELKIKMFEILESDDNLSKTPPTKIIVQIDKPVMDRKIVANKLKMLVGEDIFNEFIKQSGFNELILAQKNERKNGSH